MNTVADVSVTQVSAVSSKSAEKRFYRPELDTLRFLAFLGVFIFHVMPHDVAFYLQHPIIPLPVARLFTAACGAGAFGVDLFFALSSYLITVLLIRERTVSADGLHVKFFYIRRILRIWPLYFFVITIAVLLSFVVREQHLGWPYVAGYLLLAGNWMYAWLGPPISIATPLWSISIEEQFYLIWPLVCRRLSRRGMIGIAIGLLVAANLARVWLVSTHVLGAGVEYNTFARLDPIAWGIIVALVLGEDAPRLSVLQRALLFLSSIALWCTVSEFARLNAPKAVAPVIGTLVGRPLVAVGAIAMLIACIGAPSAGFRWMTAPWLRYLGRISYGLYVYHMAGLLLARRFFPTNTVIGYASYAACGLLATLVFSAVSYRWLETPFLHLKERFAVVRSRPV
jgi:peptidoglycan/LPS O-acetylase OafA/YrhL